MCVYTEDNAWLSLSIIFKTIFSWTVDPGDIWSLVFGYWWDDHTPIVDSGVNESPLSLSLFGELSLVQIWFQQVVDASPSGHDSCSPHLITLKLAPNTRSFLFWTSFGTLKQRTFPLQTACSMILCALKALVMRWSKIVSPHAINLKGS